MNPECPFVARVVDFAAGELSPPDQLKIENHLLECLGCREELASYRQLISKLRLLPVPEASEDLAQRVLAAVREPPAESSQRKIIWLWSAAAVALLSFLPFIHRAWTPAASTVATGMTKNPRTSLGLAIHWLCSQQEADGSWNAEKWGGNQNFQVALTALPTIAIIRSHPSTPERAAVAARAVEWLCAQQSDDGTFGPENLGIPYNHSIATLALLHAYGQNHDPALKRPIDIAVAAMVHAQSRDGGWGWRGAVSSDRTITGWHVEALRLAHELGVKNSRNALDRGIAWEATHLDPASEVDIASIPPDKILTRNENALGKAGLDLCSFYFLTASLQREQDKVSQRQLAAIRQSLVLDQVPKGEDSGSWTPDDRWGRRGGRIYSTALASLSLTDP
jgi:hypothetical protein